MLEFYSLSIYEYIIENILFFLSAMRFFYPKSFFRVIVFLNKKINPNNTRQFIRIFKLYVL